MAKKEATGVKKLSQLKKDVININSEMVALEKELKALSNNLNAMIKGDADGPYWNGRHAVNFFSTARANLKNDITDYVSARNRLNALAMLYEKTAAKNK